MNESLQYAAATIEGKINVVLYRMASQEPGGANYPINARRTVECSFNETFQNDEELEKALDAFRKTVLEAARR